MTEEITFEEALESLRKIVDSLNEGKMPLDKSLEAFEKGIKLVRICENRLTDAEQKVLLLSGKDGEYVEEPFVGAEN